MNNFIYKQQVCTYIFTSYASALYKSQFLTDFLQILYKNYHYPREAKIVDYNKSYTLWWRFWFLGPKELFFQLPFFHFIIGRIIIRIFKHIRYFLAFAHLALYFKNNWFRLVTAVQCKQ